MGPLRVQSHEGQQNIVNESWSCKCGIRSQAVRLTCEHVLSCDCEEKKSDS